MAGQLPELTERQAAILEYVVEDYVVGGQPVGSKALTSRRRMQVSSSTVRYELAELEDLGYLTHPHTSAGRLPTDLGYRFYVDRLLEALEPRPHELPVDVSEGRGGMDAALQAITEALAEVTHLLALVTAPPIETTIVRHVEVLLVQPQVVVVVVITSTGGVSKRVFVFNEPVDPGLADWAAAYLHEQVAGLTLGARTLRNRIEDPGLSPREREFLETLRPALTDLVQTAEQALYIGGTAGAMDEFQQGDIDAFRGVLEALERRTTLLDVIRSTLDPRRPFVRVGSEFEDPTFEKVSFVGAPYGLSHRSLGTVGLLGPTRMDYVKAIDAVRSAALRLSHLVEELYEA